MGDRQVWRCGRFELVLDHTLVMAILNLTPDSFSDGGRFASGADAIEEGRRAVEQGAEILDVGGESTRPGAADVPAEEEIARTLPVVEALVAEGRVPVSIDTRHANVGRRAVEAGADILNDVAGFRDPRMRELAAECDAGCVVMHMLGEPGTMQQAPHYDDVVGEVRDWLVERAGELELAGVARERICLDPGIGFGKDLGHNLALLRATPEFASLGYPLLLGTSRKRFIGQITGVEVAGERVAGSVAAALWTAMGGADVVRVHDVPETVQALKVLEALRDSTR